MSPSDRPRRVTPGLPVLLIAVGAGVALLQSASSRDGALQVYCAHDSVYSQQILDEFTRQTGIPVQPRFDTEATKSLELVNLLQAEKGNPRCDVFWNNQVLGTAELLEAGVLQPYKGPGFERIPDGFKDPDGHWVGFGGRLRVYIVNTENAEASADAVQTLFDNADLSRTAIAEPLFGTTLSHYSILWQELGPEGLKAWHRDLRDRGIREVDGNSKTKNLVAEGVCDVALTDTDDFYVAKDDGKPVAMLPVRLSDGRAICIPNSVAIIRGTKRLADAQRLVDFLLSAETELAMANSRSRQIPIGSVDDGELPDEVRELKTWASDPYDLTQAIDARRECREWLQTEYLE